MANLNKVMLIGRLTRDPEERAFPNGGKVANIGFAVNNHKKNQQTGQWEDVAVWLDVKAFNREQGRKLADLAMTYLRKGHQAYIEGHLVLEEWEKDGQKRSKLVIHADSIELLQPKGDSGSGGGSRPVSSSASPRPSATVPAYGSVDEDIPPTIDAGPTGEDIPF
jgi:single-strand DNA-binding protein